MGAVVRGWMLKLVADGVPASASNVYATGAGTWTSLRARAFLFTDCEIGRWKSGRKWAAAHRKHLRAPVGFRIAIVRYRRKERAA